MRHEGNRCAKAEQRDEEIMNAYYDALKELKYSSTKEVMDMVVNTPCSRFYISASRAMIVIFTMLKGEKAVMSKTKSEMFDEIYSRFLKARKQYKGMSLDGLVRMVINSPAPKFYLTPESAYVIISKIRKRWREQGKRLR